MFQSPLKTVTEKLKPTQSKSGISSLKFERASDFKKFIGFIKTETEELEKIKLPTIAEVKPKSKSGGLLGLLGLGLLGGLGSAFGRGESNERTSSEGGTASEFNNELLLTKNIRKVQKNFGGSKFFKSDKSLKKAFKKTFKKPSKSQIQDLKLKKGVRKTIRENKIKELLKEKKLLEDQKRFSKKFKFGDDLDMKILKEDIKVINDDIKNLVDASKVDDDIFKIIDSEKYTTSNFKSRVNALRQIIDESKVSFDRRGNVKFAPQSDLASRLTIQNIINSSPQGKDLIKNITKMDPLLFDVPEGGTLFSKILGKNKGIKIENKMGIVRESLDDAFTNIGKKTKPLRKFFAPAAKNIGKIKIPFTGIKLTSLSGLKGIFLPLDLINLGVSFNELGLVDFSDGILKPKVGRDNIVTSVYDMFTAFYNAGVEGLGFDDAHKRLKISKPKDRDISGSIIPFTNIGAYKINPRRIVDTYNEEILEARKNKKLRDIFNASNFDTSMLNNPNIQFPKSNVFAIQKPNGADFAVPYEYSEGLYDFTMPLKIKLNKQ